MFIKNTTYLTELNITGLEIKDGISIVCIEKKGPINTTRSYYYSKTSALENLEEKDFIKFKEDANLNHFVVMKKGFKEFYKHTGFGLPEYEQIWDDYVYNPKELFKDLQNEAVNPEELEFVEVSRYDETIYPFNYGKSRTGILPHMVRYNGYCYMIRDIDYDLEKVKEFLLEKEKEGIVRLKRAKDSFYSVDDEGIIREIEGYNKDENSGDRYINFFCLISNDSPLPSGFFGEVPYVKEWLEQFKIVRENQE